MPRTKKSFQLAKSVRKTDGNMTKFVRINGKLKCKRCLEADKEALNKKITCTAMQNGIINDCSVLLTRVDLNKIKIKPSVETDFQDSDTTSFHSEDWTSNGFLSQINSDRDDDCEHEVEKEKGPEEIEIEAAALQIEAAINKYSFTIVSPFESDQSYESSDRIASDIERLISEEEMHSNADANVTHVDESPSKEFKLDCATDEGQNLSNMKAKVKQNDSDSEVIGEKDDTQSALNTSHGFWSMLLSKRRDSMG